MAFIEIQDLKTHLKNYHVNAISDGDASIAQEAIDSAMLTAGRYLNRFDTDAIFNSTGAAKVKYGELITYIKDIAVWRFSKLATVSISLELAKTGYDDAIRELNKISLGKPEPIGWPYPEVEPTQTDYTVASRTKRRNHLN